LQIFVKINENPIETDVKQTAYATKFTCTQLTYNKVIVYACAN